MVMDGKSGGGKIQKDKKYWVFLADGSFILYWITSYYFFFYSASMLSIYYCDTSFCFQEVYALVICFHMLAYVILHSCLAI